MRESNGDLLSSLPSPWQGVRFGPKLGQIGPKWYKPETFSYQISVHFDMPKCTQIWSEKVTLKAKSDIGLPGFDHHSAGGLRRSRFSSLWSLHFDLHCYIYRESGVRKITGFKGVNKTKKFNFNGYIPWIEFFKVHFQVSNHLQTEIQKGCNNYPFSIFAIFFQGVARQALHCSTWVSTRSEKVPDLSDFGNFHLVLFFLVSSLSWR